MRVSSIGYSMPAKGLNFSAKANKVFDKNKTIEKEDLYTGMGNDRLVMDGNASRFFKVVENLSNPKVGSKFIIEPTLPKYEGLRLLVTPDTKIESENMSISIKNGENNPSFKGKLYGSIRDEKGKLDHKMMMEYARFWAEGMSDTVNGMYKDSLYAPHLKEDYNFYIPTDGDGTRYKDITSLQGGVTKPASRIPATMHGAQMSLVQGVITNFAKTTKLDDGFDYVFVKPAQGSAFGFLEGLRKGQIPTDKPIVFSWGDNFSDVNVSRLMKNHEEGNSGFTVTVLPVDKAKTKALSIVKTSDVESRKIDKFVEKPQDDDFIESCVLPEFGEDKCLSAVGPYILSPEALTWIKENYSENPKSFHNPDKGYDFSSMVIAPMLEAFNNGEILDENGKELDMKFDIIHNSETWSDLGSQKDFSQAMKDITLSMYRYLPFEMRQSIKENVDKNGNITFDKQASSMLKLMSYELGLKAENVIAYCKD